MTASGLNKDYLWVHDNARFNGLHIMGSQGSGKSRLMGRVIAFLDFLRGIPVVVLDPNGGTVDNFVDRMMRLPKALQQQLWPRVHYVDMSGQAAIVPFPLYYRLNPSESLETIARRYLEVVRRLDPHLERASVEGWNALNRVGTDVGMVLATLGLQITEAPSLLHSPQQWQSRFAQALATYPEVQPAVENLRRFAKNKPDFRLRRADAFLTKIQMFLLDPTMRAMFGAPSPGINWAEVIDQRAAVLLDFRHELTQERRHFKLLWVFLYLVTFLKYRGYAGRQFPVSLLIDEITQLLQVHTATEHSLLAEDLEELVSVVARNYGVWLTLAHQSLTQLDFRMQSALMRMGTQIIGVTPDPQDAFTLAKWLTTYDPYRVKKQEPVWMSVTEPPILQFFSNHYGPVPKIIDYREIEFTPEEQYLLAMQQFQGLRKFEFLAKIAQGEGNLQGNLHTLSIAQIDPGLYPIEAVLAPARYQLAQRHGLEREPLLAEIQARLQVQSAAPLAILKQAPVASTYDPARNLPIPAVADPSASAETVGTASTTDAEEFWR